METAEPWKDGAREARSIARDRRQFAYLLRRALFDLQSCEPPCVAKNRGGDGSARSYAIQAVYRQMVQGLDDVFTEFMNYLVMPLDEIDDFCAEAVEHHPPMSVISGVECLVRIRADTKNNNTRKGIIQRLDKLVHRADADADSTPVLVTSTASNEQVYVDEARGGGFDPYVWAWGKFGLRWTK